MGRRHHKLLGLIANQELFQKSFLDIDTGTHIPVHIHGHTSTCTYTHISKHKYYRCIYTYGHTNSHINLHSFANTQALTHTLSCSPTTHLYAYVHTQHYPFTPVYPHTHTKKHIRGAHSFALASSKGGAKALTEKSGQGHYTCPLISFS